MKHHRSPSGGTHVPGALVLVVLVVLTVIACSPGRARAQFGEAVSIVPGPDGTPEVLVLRPTSDRGDAALLVFAPTPEGAWRRTGTLRPVDPVAPYEGFTPALSVSPDLVAVGAADAGSLWAANVYARGEEGWVAAGRIPFAADATGDGKASTVTLPFLMRMMRAPSRAVALGPGGARSAAWTQGPEGDVVRILDRSPDGAWRAASELAAPGDAPFGRGVTLAFAGERVLVGVPGAGPGTVLAYAPGAEDGWVLEGRLDAPDLPDGARFGAALAVTDDGVWVGAPGAGLVVPYARSEGAWRAGAPVSPPAADAGGGDGGGPGGGGTADHGASAGPSAQGPPGGWFGFALAVAGDELWVGAPATDGFTGAVHRYRRDGPGSWRWVGTLEPGLEEAGFGVALDLAGGVAVVGAPLAAHRSGRAAVYERKGEGWSDARWLAGAPALSSVTGGEVRCDEGRAASFDCDGVDLLAFLDLETLGAGPGERVSDVWGWTDPETGREYALVGRTAGMAIVDVTEPSSPLFVGLVPGNPSNARDIKTYGHHAFFTGDGAGDHGLVVFDLTRLRTPPANGERPATFEPDARYTGIASAHNLILNPETGVAIPVGANGGGETCGGGFHMVDVSSPLEPTFLGCYTDDVGLIAPGRSHDGQCVVYRGPDERFRDRQVCFASNETALRILDITRPDSVREVAIASYPGVAYAHQGWLTEDQRYFFMNDELDELVGLADRTRTLVWDVAELDDPVLVADVLGPDGATDHNLFIRGDRLYEANYQAGFRVLDISDPENPVELGSFDTTPYDGNPPGFGSGAWTAYPFLDSGTVVVSSMYEGLFLLRPRRVIP